VRDKANRLRSTSTYLGHRYLPLASSQWVVSLLDLGLEFGPGRGRPIIRDGVRSSSDPPKIQAHANAICHLVEAEVKKKPQILRLPPSNGARYRDTTALRHYQYRDEESKQCPRQA